MILGVLVSILFTELTGLSAGLILPAYFVLCLSSPWRIVYTLLIALVSAGLMRLAARWVVLFGRRRLAMVLLLSFCFMLLFLIAALFQKEEATAFRDAAYSFTGVLWIAVPFSLLNFFPLIGHNAVSGPHQPSVGQWILLAYFITVWANDTFAYCVGSLIGRHKFFERISPKKTWEGTLGGAVLTLVLACLYTRLFARVPLSAQQWMGLALIVVVLGSLGDLVESFFKRRMNVKDSGNILPGHGGILDRFDSALMSLPFVLLYLQLVL